MLVFSHMKILGIESSCDETAMALLDVSAKIKPSFGGKINHFKLLKNIVLSQIEIHQKYGGIVPEVAARAHVEAIVPVIKEVLGKITPDLIAVTQGPGLITSLAVGVQAAKTLSFARHIPLVGVNHLEGHLWSFLLNKSLSTIGYRLPAVALIVSGGHTELILVKGIGKYKLIGQTLDDAAGEAFDKIAKMLGLSYPGGPIVAHFAKEGDKNRINLPRPMLSSHDFNFSFSGLKTAVKYHLRDMAPTGNFSQAFIKDVCASFQAAVIDVLIAKTLKAGEKYQAKSIILGGGVSANEELIKNLGYKVKESGWDFYCPEPWLTGDNAAMIALAGYFNKQKASKQLWRKLAADSNLSLVINR